MELHYLFFIARTSRKVRSGLQKVLNQLDHSLTMDQWLIVYVLYIKGEMSQVDMATYSLKDPPAITRIVDHLIFKNFLEKKVSPIDRRSFNVTLTKEGVDLVKYILPNVIEYRNKGWDGLSEEDYVTLKRILNQIFYNS